MRKLGVLGITIVGLMILASAGVTLMLPLILIGEIVNGSSPWPLVVVAILLGTIPFALLVALGRWLIVHRQCLAEQWFEDDDSLDVAFGGTALIGALLGVAGVWLTVNGISGVFGDVAGAIQQVPQAQRTFGHMMLRAFVWQAPAFISTLVTLGFGLLLLFRRTSIAGWLTRGEGGGSQEGPQLDAREHAPAIGE